MESLTLYRPQTYIRYLELSHNKLEDVPHTLSQLPILEGVNKRYKDVGTWNFSSEKTRGS